MEKELIDFANEFSEKYLENESGDYFSKNGKYHIKYFDGILQGSTKNNPARIHNKTKICELSKKVLTHEDITPNFVYYSIIWCFIRPKYKSDIQTDKIAMEHYLSTNRKKKDVLKGMYYVLNNTNVKNMAKRLKILT